MRVRMLEPGEEGGCTAEERGFETCQLHMRHWEIRDAKGGVQRVDGEGVIGMFPVLREGGYRADRVHRAGRVEGEETSGRFVYQSCTGGNYTAEGRNTLEGGSFGGHLTFVPGTIDDPEGAPFDVAVKAFRLVHPGYIF